MLKEQEVEAALQEGQFMKPKVASTKQESLKDKLMQNPTRRLNSNS